MSNKILSFTSFNTMIECVYNEIYPNFLLSLIQYCNFKPDWVDISTLTPCDAAQQDMTRSLDTWQFDNEYLNELLKDKVALGKDILINGMYFPFYGEDNLVGYGGHRLISLQILQHIQPFNNQFLFIRYPKEYIAANWRRTHPDLDLGTIDKNIDIPFVNWNTQRVVIIQSNNIKTIIEGFTHISDILGDKIFYAKDFLKPNPIFNNPKLFEEFINGNK